MCAVRITRRARDQQLSRTHTPDSETNNFFCRARRDGRSANGTMTFRRASTTPLGQMQNHPPTDLAQPSSAEPAAAMASFEAEPSRYTKDDLLDVFRAQKMTDDPSRLYISGWDPSNINGTSGRGWGKSNENHIPQEPGACWDQNGETAPMGLQDYSMDEKEVRRAGALFPSGSKLIRSQAFTSDINSPLKPPTQNKEGHQANGSGRKPSISHGSGNAYGVTSPSSATRPSTRRRETVDSNPFSNSGLGSPTAPNRFARDDQTYWFNRKGGDAKDAEAEEQLGDQGSRDQGKSGIPNLMRANTAGSVGMSSIWPSSNPTTPGAGGFGNFSIGSSAVGDKRVGGAAGGSRLAHLMPKDSSENMSAKGSDANAPPQQSWRNRPRTDTDPFGDDELSGSAMLGGSQDTNSAAGNRAGTLGTPVKGSAGDFGMAGLNLDTDDDPNSPSETNPYRSPANRDDGESGNDKHFGGGSQEQGAPFSGLPRGFAPGAFDGSDRSQTSSVGAKGYPLGNLSGWPAPGPSTGTPDRDRPNFGGAFGNSLFGNMGELQSPGLGNLGNVFGPSGSGGLGAGSIGRGSKLGSLFPAAMQAQMQGNDHEAGAEGNDLRQGNPLGAIGRGNFPAPPRDTESPMRSNRGVFEDLFPSSDANRALGHMPGSDGPGQSFTPIPGGLPFGGPVPSELSSAQSRQMVMPDRMRWVYLDPQGQVQGPFTGLEMNDWYKANFFTPDLRVKKVEDPEFEPLGQLIRRIGNSREPFLVPQIGIPHGPPAQGGGYSGNTGVVPPLSGVFPSFGRTLTAEEQNNLERRKQEEQYIMAQQRDYVMRQQAMTKFPIHNPALQHHSSAQSLQSQPSFGNISNPAQQPPTMSGLGAFMEPGSGPLHGRNEQFRQEDMGNLSGPDRQMLAAMGSESADADDGAEGGMRSGLPQTGQLSEDSEGFRERLQEFEGLRAQHEAQQAAQAEEERAAAETQDSDALPATSAARQSVKAGKKKKLSEDEALSLTEQVQIAQAAVAAGVLPEEATEPGMPMPFPPPSSTTPLPAPTAQRARSNLPEQYSRSQTGTPEAVQPPPLAPWAKEPGHEGQRGPSLKEIQEAEARKAAKAEELAAAQRKAAMEQEGALMRERAAAAAAAATAAALPASSTWGHGSPGAGTTPWAKPTPQKGANIPASVSASSLSKKTLAEIQREEEVRKQKAMQTAIQTGSPVSTTKSYANLAGKTHSPAIPNAPSPAAAAAPPPGPGWATVGAGGKVKAPPGTAVPVRSASNASAKPAPVAVAARPSPKPSPAVAPAPRPVPASSGNTAMDEFNAWTHRELSRGINTDGKSIPKHPIDSRSNEFCSHHLPVDSGSPAPRHWSDCRCSLRQLHHHGWQTLCRRVCPPQEACGEGHL